MPHAPVAIPASRLALAAYITTAAVAVLVGAPVVTGLIVDPTTVTVLFLVGSAAASLATACQIVVYFSWRHTLAALALTVAIAWPAEVAGMRWGFPFSARYEYHAALWPDLPGGLPLPVLLSWFVVLGLPIVLLGRTRFGLVARSALCGLAVVAVDLLVEPMACSMGLWKWPSGGDYFGSPLGNLAGWWVVGFAFYAAFYACDLRLGQVDAPAFGSFDRAWGTVNALCLAMACGGAAARTGNALPALLSLAIMAPLGYWWFVGLRAGHDSTPVAS
jgi:uncharacterized membrane protein